MARQTVVPTISPQLRLTTVIENPAKAPAAADSTGWRCFLPHTFLALLLVMTTYEAIKETVFPELTKWQSHVLTIVFTTLLGCAVAFLVFRKRHELVHQLAEELAERHQAEEALRAEREFIRLVLDTDPNPIFVKDADGRFVLA